MSRVVKSAHEGAPRPEPERGATTGKLFSLEARGEKPAQGEGGDRKSEACEAREPRAAFVNRSEKGREASD